MKKDNSQFRTAQERANGLAALALSVISGCDEFILVTSQRDKWRAEKFEQALKQWVEADEDAERLYDGGDI